MPPLLYHDADTEKNNHTSDLHYIVVCFTLQSAIVWEHANSTQTQQGIEPKTVLSWWWRSQDHSICILKTTIKFYRSPIPTISIPHCCLATSHLDSGFGFILWGPMPLNCSIHILSLPCLTCTLHMCGNIIPAFQRLCHVLPCFKREQIWNSQQLATESIGNRSAIGGQKPFGVLDQAYTLMYPIWTGNKVMLFTLHKVPTWNQLILVEQLQEPQGCQKFESISYFKNMTKRGHWKQCSNQRIPPSITITTINHCSCKKKKGGNTQTLVLK